MRTIQLCLVILTAIFAAGCPKYRPPVDFNNPDSLVNKLDLNPRLKVMQDQYFCYRFGFNYVGGSGNPCAGSVSDGPAKAKALRNEFLETTVPYLDDAYVNYITDLQKGRDRVNFVADLIELGTSAAVGITNGERSLKIMGIALTAFRGGRRSADLNFYKEQTTPILINKMDANRAKVRAAILEREKKEVDDYPIGAAISDVVDYYNAGTLVRAFTELAKDTAVDAKQSEETVLQLKGVPITHEATQAARDASVLAKQILDTLRDELKDSARAPAATTKLQNMIKTLEADPDLKQMLTEAKVSSSDTDGAKIRGALVSMRRIASDKGDTTKLDKINQSIIDNGK